jgi:carboxypeptidase C (cathepsin A)
MRRQPDTHRLMPFVACALLLTLRCPTAAWSATEPAPGKPPADAAPKFSQELEPFPAPKSVKDSAVIGGKRIEYQVTVGSIALRDDDGKLQGEVVYTAFTIPGQASRPVTFAFNGGPGAASAYLDIGAIGPKRVDFGGEHASPSDPPVLRDNPSSWLDFTDLVFIDPIGTGYSRTRVDEEQTKKAFLTGKSDVEYLSRVVFDWLLQNNRMTSGKYLIGESYGGSRVPRMAHFLQTTLGVGVSGITMLSPALDMAISEDEVLSPMSDVVHLPTMAAGYLERQGKPLDDSTLGPIELYARTDFVTDILAGRADQSATDRVAAKVAQLTGLDPALVRQMDGRVDVTTYLRESRRKEGLIGSGYDSNYTAFDPFPERAQPDYDDPTFARETALFVSAMTNLIVNQVGWKVAARYYLNNFDLNRKFARDDHDSPVTGLRKALAADPQMSAVIAHGYTDFACPYFMSKLIVSQLPSFGVTNRVKVLVYPGGHMFYSRLASAAAFRHDMKSVYESHN